MLPDHLGKVNASTKGTPCMICISIRLFIFFCLLGQMDVIHCQGQEEAVDDPQRDKSISRAQTVFFEEEIRPVLANRCFRCHADKKQENDFLKRNRNSLPEKITTQGKP